MAEDKVLTTETQKSAVFLSVSQYLHPHGPGRRYKKICITSTTGITPGSPALIQYAQAQIIAVRYFASSHLIVCDLSISTVNPGFT